MEKKPKYENCFLYSMWTGYLKVHEGDIYDTREDSLFYFITKNNPRRLLCANEPGVVYNGQIWFREKNDELAKQKMIEHEEQAIEALQEEIENHRHKIEILKGEK